MLEIFDMEIPVFQPQLPFRPIPVYGKRSSSGTQSSISIGQTINAAKSHEQQLLFAKHANLMPPIGRLGPLAEYHIHHLSQFGNIEPSQVQQEINKFSVKDFALLSEVQRRHAIAQSKAQHFQSFQPSKLFGIDIEKSQKESNIVPLGIPLDKDRPELDALTVPVIVSCRNPFSTQYGYGRKVFPCPQCRYTTDRRNNLKRHMLTMHQTCTKTLDCCGIVFATKASLREHAMIFHYHGYTCLYCGRRFCRKALLKRHLSVHNGQKDYVCPVCDYATSHKSNLERHRKVHCRHDDRSQGDNESGTDEILSCGLECHSADDNNNNNNGHDVASSSDDENGEINVDSD